MMNLVELLQLKGLDTTKKIKLVRHQDQRYDVEELRRRGQLEIYQSYQGKPIFDCDYVISFTGMEGTKAKLFSVYTVLAKKSANDVPLPKDFIYPKMEIKDCWHYELEEVPGFEDFKDRLVIDWGKSTLSWHQWLSKKPVTEILPQGYITDFPGYLDFILNFDELLTIINYPDANREWHRRLSAVAGVYLIVDKVTGNQYVGSAYGNEGILGRWKSYTKNGHGGNKLLKSLVKNAPSYAQNLRFTILRTLPKSLTKREVIEYESLYKTKLGTKAFGLNLN